MEQLTAIATDAWALSWVRALVIILASLVLAKLVDLLISRVLLRFTGRTDTDLDDRLIELLHRPTFVSVVLAGIYFAVKALAPEEGAERLLVRAIVTAALLVWTIAGWKLLSTVLVGLSRLADRVAWLDGRTLPLFDNLGKLAIFAIASYGLLVVWNLNIAPWLASAGIVGIAVGFAAKDTLANLFGGLFVIVDAPYRIGDFINLGSGERGEVIKIGLRSTRLLTREDVEITLPNAHIANSKIVNESGGPYEKTRVAIQVGVAYGSDVDQVREVLMAAARSVEDVVPEPEPRIRFMEMGDSALLFTVQAWVEVPSSRGLCIDGLNTAIYKALGRANIEIPFPQRVVHQPPSS